MTQGAVSSLASDAIPAHRTVLKCKWMTSITCSLTAAADPLAVLGMTGVVFSQLTVVLHSGRVARGGQPVDPLAGGPARVARAPTERGHASGLANGTQLAVPQSGSGELAIGMDAA